MLTMSVDLDESDELPGYFKITRKTSGKLSNDYTRTVTLQGYRDEDPDDPYEPGESQGEMYYYYYDSSASESGKTYTYTVEFMKKKNGEAVTLAKLTRKIFKFKISYIDSLGSTVSSKTGKNVIQLSWRENLSPDSFSIYTRDYNHKAGEFEVTKLEKEVNGDVTSTTFQSGQCNHTTVQYPRCGYVWVVPYKSSPHSIGFGAEKIYGDLHNVDSITLTKKSNGINVNVAAYGKKHVVSGYIIERSVNGAAWERVIKYSKSTFKSKGYEYLDSNVQKGMQYKYRVIPYYSWKDTVIKSGENALTVSKEKSLENKGLLKKRPSMTF